MCSARRSKIYSQAPVLSHASWNGRTLQQIVFVYWRPVSRDRGSHSGAIRTVICILYKNALTARRLPPVITAMLRWQAMPHMHPRLLLTPAATYCHLPAFVAAWSLCTTARRAPPKACETDMPASYSRHDVVVPCDSAYPCTHSPARRQNELLSPV